MNRLIKKSTKQITVYHTTTKDSWEKIKKDKFIVPQGSDGAGLTFDDATEEEINHFKDYVFFSTTMEEAKNYASFFDESCVILECSIDENKLLPDKTDCWDCETWQESAEKNQQVCVKGKLSIQCVKKIHNI